MTSNRRNRASALLSGTAAAALASLLAATPAQAIVPNDNQTPAQIVDNAGGVNGVGMFYRNDGFVCTGTLINPRTVLFAAHCVNDRPESDYRTGNIRSAFSFNVNALPGFQNWTSNGFASNPSLFVYDISQIQYNPLSVARPEGLGFLEGDIALATLAQPVTSQLNQATLSLSSTIPTWALLFSPLPTPATIDPVKGTGYHVNITGYGRSGSGTTGASQGIDWRRRAAENMLGSLSSLDKRNDFLFGPGPSTNPQVLYNLDFDDPNKANPFDFNLYKDEPLAREATTAGGDSGGPLVLDAANNTLSTKNLQIGVLSGGSRFFGPQVFSSYGTQSFYQPLFLFWDYIAASSPYRYVRNANSSGAWEDGSHWVVALDPAFNVIDNSGAVVNGVPTAPGGGITATQPAFGEVCFDQRGTQLGDECQNFANGQSTPPVRTGGATAVSGIGEASLDMPGGAEEADIQLASADEADAAAPAAAAETAVAAADATASAPAAAASGGAISRADMIQGSEHQAQGNGIEFALEAPHAGVDLVANAPQGGAEIAEEAPHATSGPGFANTPNPAPTIVNGLPGATGFVPNNVDPVVSTTAGQTVKGRYYDVTLTSGTVQTTTLSSKVTVDRLSLGGLHTLDIKSNGDLTSLIDINQTFGLMNVNGKLATNGDYLITQGVLAGSGTVQTPFLTSVAGGFSPAAASNTNVSTNFGRGSVGTLTINGNLIMSSGSFYNVDIGASGTSDRIAVTGVAGSTSFGNASVGGTLSIAPVSGFQTATPSTYRILTTAGTRTGTFAAPANLSAILLTSLTYGTNFVDLTVRAQSYRNVVNLADPVQAAYAGLMDRNRGNTAVQTLFDVLDFEPSAAVIQSTFASWAPTTETTIRSLGKSMASNVSQFFDARLGKSDRGSNGGTIAMIGQPVQTASLNLTAAGAAMGSSAVLSDVAASTAAQEVETVSGGINEDMAIYLAGGYLDGEGRSMPRAGAAATDDEFDGFFIAAGAEHYLDEDNVIGFGLYYANLDSSAALGNSVESSLISGTLYGRSMLGPLQMDAQLTAGSLGTDTTRNVALGGTPYTLTSQDANLLVTTSLDLAYPFGGESFSVAPTVGMRSTLIDFSRAIETGGPMALTVDRPDYHSLQGRAGLDVEGGSASSSVQFLGSAFYVHEFRDPETFVAANFTNGVGPLVAFPLAGQDEDWFELAAGIRINSGNLSFDLSGFATVDRYDAESRGISAGMTYRF